MKILVSKCCVVDHVKSRSEFPDLLSFESKIVPRQRRVRLAIGQSGAICKEAITSLPLFLLCINVVILRLASS